MNKSTITFSAILLTSLILTSCGNKNTNISNSAIPKSEANNTEPSELKSEDGQVKADNKQTSAETKTMTMVFQEYSEGDYPHLLFKDVASGEQFDFRFLDDNNLSGLKILLNDEQAAFGVKANPAYLNKTFLVDATKKTLSDSDLDGKTIQVKDWVITSIKLK